MWRSAAGNFADLFLTLRDPRHHRAQLSTHLFDWVVATCILQFAESLAAAVALGNPLFRKLAVLNFFKNLFHLCLG